MARHNQNPADPNQTPPAATRADRTPSGPGGGSRAAATAARLEPSRPPASDDAPTMLALDFLPA